MEYYTREIYDLNQGDSSSSHAWDEAASVYQEHLYDIAPRLTPSARRLATFLFQDCRIQSIKYLPKNIVRIDLVGNRQTRDGRQTNTGQHALIFSGVTYSTISPASAGDKWVCEELDLEENKTRYMVLLENSEFMIDFDRVKISIDPDKVITITQSIAELA